MELFTPEEYMMIEISNLHGIDKVDYQDRISWFHNEFNPAQISSAESPNQARIAYEEYSKITQGNLSNYCISLDATASVGQLISVLLKCYKTAQICNVVGHTRNDPYSIIHKATGLADIPRKRCKEAIMTQSYGSEAIPKEVYGDNLDVFFNAMNQEAPALLEYVDFTQSLWNPQVTKHTWTMPDNFEVILPSTTKVKETVTLLGKPITVQYEIEGAQEKSRELSASIIHSCDALVVREMTARCGHGLLHHREDKALEMKLDALAERTGFKSARLLYLNPERKNEFVLPDSSFYLVAVH